MQRSLNIEGMLPSFAFIILRFLHICTPDAWPPSHLRFPWEKINQEQPIPLFWLRTHFFAFLSFLSHNAIFFTEYMKKTSDDNENRSQGQHQLSPEWVILTKPCLLLSWIWKALQCVPIFHWLNGFSANEEYWNISLKADVSLSLIGREKRSRVLS